MTLTYNVESLEVGIDSSAQKIQLSFVDQHLGCLVQAILTPVSARQLITALQVQLGVLEKTPVNQVKV